MLAHRADWGGSTIVAVHSFAAERREVVVEVGDDVEEAVDLLDSGHVVPEDGAIRVALDPFGFGWYRLRRGGQRVAP